MVEEQVEAEAKEEAEVEVDLVEGENKKEDHQFCPTRFVHPLCPCALVSLCPCPLVEHVENHGLTLRKAGLY